MLQVDGVVILAPLVDLGFGLDISRVRGDEAVVTIMSGGSAYGGTTGMRWLEAMPLL